MNPKLLTAPQRRALDRLQAHPAFRVRNGWRFKGGERFSLKTATVLFSLGLVARSGAYVQLTDVGRRVLNAPKTVAAALPPRSPRASRPYRPQEVATASPEVRRWWID